MKKKRCLRPDILVQIDLQNRKNAFWAPKHSFVGPCSSITTTLAWLMLTSLCGWLLVSWRLAGWLPGWWLAGWPAGDWLAGWEVHFGHLFGTLF